jgi:hypothetical protein
MTSLYRSSCGKLYSCSPNKHPLAQDPRSPAMPNFPDPKSLRATAAAVREAEAARRKAQEEAERRLAEAAAERERIEAEASRLSLKRRRDAARIARVVSRAAGAAAASGERRYRRDLPGDLAGEISKVLAGIGFRPKHIKPPFVKVRQQLDLLWNSIQRAVELDIGSSPVYEQLSRANEAPESLLKFGSVVDAIRDFGGIENLVGSIGRSRARLEQALLGEGLIPSRFALDHTQEHDHRSSALVALVQSVRKHQQLLIEALEELGKSSPDLRVVNDEGAVTANSRSSRVMFEVSWPTSEWSTQLITRDWSATFCIWAGSRSGQGLLTSIRDSLAAAAGLGLEACVFETTAIPRNLDRWGANDVRVVRYQGSPIGVFPQDPAMLCQLLRSLGFSCSIEEASEQEARLLVSWAASDRARS